MKFSIQTLIWGSVLLALVFAGSLAFLPKPVEVELANASVGPLQLTVREDGRTRIREKYVVSAPVAGRLSRIELNAGDPVVKDETLIAVILPAEPTMLDARAKAQAKARVEQAEVSLRRAKATEEEVKVGFELSQTRYERLGALLEKQGVAQAEFEDAEADYLAGTHRLRTAKFDGEIAAFELQMAEAALLQFAEDDERVAEPFEVFSPISGNVLRVMQESSTVLTVGVPLIEVGDPQNLEIEIDVLSTDAVKIAAGADLEVQHWGGDESLAGMVRVVEPAAFTKVSSLGVEEQRVNVIADFDVLPEKLARLGDGYRVEADIVVQNLPSELKIPNSALFRHERDWHVFVVREKIAYLTKVEIGLQNDLESQVIGGINAGDTVVVYPASNLADGVRVKTQ
ncbi:MAG: efflux RND transporter periplasmic adaptor subunit [Aureliella sp.]